MDTFIDVFILHRNLGQTVAIHTWSSACRLLEIYTYAHTFIHVRLTYYMQQRSTLINLHLLNYASVQWSLRLVVLWASALDRR